MNSDHTPLPIYHP
jgi:hypothetical protein